MANAAYDAWEFQSSRPRGRTRRASAASAEPRQCRFNPRVLAGGRDVIRHLISFRMVCFNPRVLAGGRDIYNSGRNCRMVVSIPASSREDATANARYDR